MSEKTETSHTEAKHASSEVITIRKDSLWKYTTFILAAILIVGAFVFFIKGNDTSPTARVIDNSGQQLPGAKANVGIDDDAVLGDKKAPVTVIEL